MCFRLYFVKDTTVSATAAATVRQMVSVLFDRVVTEDTKPIGTYSFIVVIPTILSQLMILDFFENISGLPVLDQKVGENQI